MATAINEVCANATYDRLCFRREKEDYEIWELGKSLFAVFHKGIERPQVSIELSNHIIVMFAPVKSQADISIRGKSVIILNEMQAEKGKVRIFAEDKYIRIEQGTSSQKRKAEAKEAMLICNLETDKKAYIYDLFSKGILQKNGDILMEGISSVVELALEYSDADIDERKTSGEIVCDYLNISPMKV